MPSSRQDFDRIHQGLRNRARPVTQFVPEWLDWDQDGAMAAVDAAQDVLGKRGHGIIKWGDMAEAIRQAIRGYNAKIIEDAGCQVCGADDGSLEWDNTPHKGWMYVCVDVLSCSRSYRSARNGGRRV